jgi:hypothetical protein
MLWPLAIRRIEAPLRGDIRHPPGIMLCTWGVHLPGYALCHAEARRPSSRSNGRVPGVRRLPGGRPTDLRSNAIALLVLGITGKSARLPGTCSTLTIKAFKQQSWELPWNKTRSLVGLRRSFSG